MKSLCKKGHSQIIDTNIGWTVQKFNSVLKNRKYIQLYMILLTITHWLNNRTTSIQKDLTRVNSLTMTEEMFIWTLANRVKISRKSEVFWQFVSAALNKRFSAIISVSYKMVSSETISSSKSYLPDNLWSGITLFHWINHRSMKKKLRWPKQNI